MTVVVLWLKILPVTEWVDLNVKNVKRKIKDELELDFLLDWHALGRMSLFWTQVAKKKARSIDAAFHSPRLGYLC